MDKSKKCECGCGQAVKEGNRFINGHFWRGKHSTEATRKKLSEATKGERNPNYGKRPSESTLRRMSESHKGWCPTAETRMKMSKNRKGSKHSFLTRKRMSDAAKKRYEDSDERRRMSEARKSKKFRHTPQTKAKMSVVLRKKRGDPIHREFMKKVAREWRRENPRRAHEVGVMGGLAAIASRRKNAPYRFTGVSFDSEGEKQAMRIICQKFNITPIEGVNCHVRVNGGEIDFRLENLFVEYHPHDWDGLTHDQYYNQRRRLLDENGFRDCRLIVVKSLKELEEVF